MGRRWPVDVPPPVAPGQLPVPVVSSSIGARAAGRHPVDRRRRRARDRRCVGHGRTRRDVGGRRTQVDVRRRLVGRARVRRRSEADRAAADAVGGGSGPAAARDRLRGGDGQRRRAARVAPPAGVLRCQLRARCADDARHRRQPRRADRLPPQQQLRAAVGRGVEARPRQPGLHRARARTPHRPGQPGDASWRPAPALPGLRRRRRRQRARRRLRAAPPSWPPRIPRRTTA